MKILFVKANQSFPRSSGHDVHAYGMMRALSARGHEIGLVTEHQVSAQAKDGLHLILSKRFDEIDDLVPNSIPYLQRRFTSYWGVDESISAKLNYLIKKKRFDAVVVVGLAVLPYLSQIRDAIRIWYAADEWFLHHLSLIQFSKPSTWRQLKAGMIKGLYERAFRSCTDTVWVVSQHDANFIRRVMGVHNIAITPNGVDIDHFAPVDCRKIPDSFVFWGRLDFQPNIDAIRWFGQKVFLPYKMRNPNALWSVYGFNASAEVKAFKERFGFELYENLPDLRKELAKYHLAVMPFVSGAGIKNKLLEAAAMGLPILSTSLALNGLVHPPSSIYIDNRPSGWLKIATTLHKEAPEIRQDLRRWVIENYSWDKAAKIAEESSF